MHRLRGELALAAQGIGSQAEAEACFRRAIKVAQRQGAKSWELRATMSLARLWAAQSRTEEARASIHAALQALDDGRPSARQAIWHAKVQTGRSARFVGAQGVQLHGGMGMTDELAVGHYYKRLSQLEAMFGDAEYYLNALAAA